MPETYVRTNVDQYAIYHNNNPSRPTGIKVWIRCYNNGEVVGAIIFYSADQVKDPELRTTSSNTLGYILMLYYPVDRFHEIISTLRFERPLYMSIDTESKSCSVWSLKEAIGEQEAINEIV